MLYVHTWVNLLWQGIIFCFCARYKVTSDVNLEFWNKWLEWGARDPRAPYILFLNKVFCPALPAVHNVPDFSITQRVSVASSAVITTIICCWLLRYFQNTLKRGITFRVISKHFESVREHLFLFSEQSCQSELKAFTEF